MALYAAAMALHAVIDVFTGPQGPGLTPGAGAPLLWPFSPERFASPVALLYGPKHRTMEQLVSLANVWVVVYEVLVFVPLVVAGLWWNRRRGVA
jgi:hypothetical protein